MKLCAWSIVVCAIVHVTGNKLTYGSRCNWSNEGCSNDDQCCSGRCVLRHPGTNQRCMKSEMGGLCMFSHHCASKMECQRHRCCAPHWGTCTKDSDCCLKKFHVCRKMQGFVYNRCMFDTLRPRAGCASNSICSYVLVPAVTGLLVLDFLYTYFHQLHWR